MLSAIVREVFPHSESCQLKVSRNKFVLVVELKDEGCSGDETVQLRQQVEHLQADISDRDHQVERLQGKVAELDNKVEKLQGRVMELENQRVAKLADTQETQPFFSNPTKQDVSCSGSDTPSVPWS